MCEINTKVQGFIFIIFLCISGFRNFHLPFMYSPPIVCRQHISSVTNNLMVDLVMALKFECARDTVQLLFLNIFLHHSYFASFHSSFISSRPMRYRTHISEVTKNSMADLVMA